MSSSSHNDSHNDAGRDTDDAPRDAGTLPIRNVIVDEKGNPYTHAKNRYNPFTYLDQVWNWALSKVEPKDRMMVVLTAIIAVSTIVQTCNTYTNNSSTGEQTKKLITAAEMSAHTAGHIAGAARSFSESANGIKQGIDSAVSKLNDQAQQTKLLADTSKDSASTQASNLEEIKRAQRANVSIRDVEIVDTYGLTKDDSAFAFFVVFQNSGSTSTKHLTIRPVCGPHGNFGKPFDFERTIKAQGGIPPVIGARSEMKQFTCESDKKVGTFGLIVFGQVSYGDVYGKEHITDYCWEVQNLPNADHPSVQPCTYPDDAKYNCQDEDCAIK